MVNPATPLQTPRLTVPIGTIKIIIFAPLIVFVIDIKHKMMLNDST